MDSKRVISKKISKKSVLPWIVGPIFVTFFLISVITLWRSSRMSFDEVAHQDIMHLQDIFKQIQKDCYIVDFEHVINHIDFLNIQSFTDKKVGSMELAFPKRWKGPYLKKNLRVQNKLYAVLKNKQGYFIVPGYGVRLANGKVIGKTLILDQNSDMKQLMKDEQGLDSENGVLAARIKIGSRAMKNMTSKKIDILSAIDT
jgi:hypothetical protein